MDVSSDSNHNTSSVANPTKAYDDGQVIGLSVYQSSYYHKVADFLEAGVLNKSEEETSNSSTIELDPAYKCVINFIKSSQEEQDRVSLAHRLYNQGYWTEGWIKYLMVLIEANAFRLEF